MNKQSQVSFGGPSFQSRRMPTQRERFLWEMERTIPWGKLRALVEPLDSDPTRVRGHSLELDRMLRIFFLQHWYRLSDAATHEALHDSKAMRDFACVGLGPDRTPGEHEIAGFRQLLDEYGLAGSLVEAADRHLRAEGVSVSPGTITDAALTSPRGLAAAVQRVLETRQ